MGSVGWSRQDGGGGKAGENLMDEGIAQCGRVKDS
jgi:hypothetical protein